jgi:hypothetical protein
MRDILLFVVLLGALPFALMRPVIAAAIYIVLSVGSIHKLAYGFASDFPWSALYAGVLLVSVAFNSSASLLQGLKTYYRFLPLLIVVTISTLVHFGQPWTLDRYMYFLKIQVAVVLIMSTLKSRSDLVLILAALAGSISFHAVKGSFSV